MVQSQYNNNKLTNEPVEDSNNIIKTLKYVAFDYQTLAYLRDRILLMTRFKLTQNKKVPNHQITYYKLARKVNYLLTLFGTY